MIRLCTTYIVKEIKHIIIIDAMHKFPTIVTKHFPYTTCFVMIENEDDYDDDISIREGTKCNSNTILRRIQKQQVVKHDIFHE